MKQTLIVFSILALLSVSCRGTARKTTQADNQEQRMQVVQTKDFSMTLAQTEYTIPVDMVKLAIKNNTESEAYLNEYYDIEILNGSEWKRIPLELAFIDIAYSLEAGASHEFEIALYPDKYNYKPGKYRIRKNVMTELENFELAGEFVLKAE